MKHDRPDPPRLRIRFLGLAAGMLGAALVVYLVIGALPAVDPTGLVSAVQTGLALVLLLFVVFALLFLLAAYTPALARFLADRGQYVRDLWRVPFRFLSFGGFFDSDIRHEKELASARKRARIERRQRARQTPPGHSPSPSRHTGSRKE